MNGQINNGLNVELIVALISATSIVIVAFVTNYFTSRNELKAKYRDIKEAKYTSFLKLIIDAKGKFKEEESIDINKEISETLQMIYLIGNDEVINCTKKIMQLFKRKNQTDSNLNQNKLYSEMIKAMRKDLYGKCKVRNHPSELELFIFS